MTKTSIDVCGYCSCSPSVALADVVMLVPCGDTVTHNLCTSVPKLWSFPMNTGEFLDEHRPRLTWGKVRLLVRAGVRAGVRARHQRLPILAESDVREWVAC